MLFTLAAEYLASHIGLPTTVVGRPKRLHAWVLRHQRTGCGPFEVKLRAGPTSGIVRVEILDPHAGFLGSEEEFTLLQETDFKLALERVQAHLNC